MQGLNLTTLLSYPSILNSMRAALTCMGVYTAVNSTDPTQSWSLVPGVYVVAMQSITNGQADGWPVTVLSNLIFNGETYANETCNGTNAYSNLTARVPSRRRQLLLLEDGRYSIVDELSGQDHTNGDPPLQPRRLGIVSTSAVNISFLMVMPPPPLELLNAMLSGVVNASSVVPDSDSSSDLPGQVAAGVANRNVLTLIQIDIVWQSRVQLNSLSIAMNNGAVSFVPVMAPALAAISATVPGIDTANMWLFPGADSIVAEFPSFTATGTSSSRPTATHTRSGTPSRTLSHTVGASSSITQSAAPVIGASSSSNSGVAVGAALGALALLAIIGAGLYFFVTRKSQKSRPITTNSSYSAASADEYDDEVVRNPLAPNPLATSSH